MERCSLIEWSTNYSILKSIKMKEPNIPVKGKTIGGRNLKKFFEYYFECYTLYDRHDVRYRGVSRLSAPNNPHSKECHIIESCMSKLDVRSEWSAYFNERRKVHPYWVERDAKINQVTSI